MEELKGIHLHKGRISLGSDRAGAGRTCWACRDQAPPGPSLVKPFSNPCPAPIGDSHMVDFDPGFGSVRNFVRGGVSGIGAYEPEEASGERERYCTYLAIRGK